MSRLKFHLFYIITFAGDGLSYIIGDLQGFACFVIGWVTGLMCFALMAEEAVESMRYEANGGSERVQ